VLDECYYCVDHKLDFKLVVLDSHPSDENSMIQVDGEYFDKKYFRIEFIGKRNFKRIIYFIKLIRSLDKKNVFITHSVSGSTLIRIAGLISKKRVNIILWIHQFIFLSDRTQAIKRIIYSLSASKIYFGAKQFELDWKDYIASNKFLSFIFKKEMHCSRIGIYLDRVFWNGYPALSNKSSNFSVTFASRIVHWKGLDSLIDIYDFSQRVNLKCFIMTSKIYSNYLESIVANKSNLSIIFNKSPNFLRLLEKNVHIYPTVFDKRLKYRQGIGLNVLEFLALGIPSIISEDNFQTFPELENSELIKIYDWKRLEELPGLIKNLTSLPLNNRKILAKNLLPYISIDPHMRTILDEIA
jgi:glycosyltransferase involved in cell wall biosynthesis